jgi:RNA polymerase sigma factor (sigma-70 family)
VVLATCRRVTEDWHAAEDCFQAAFLVLATKANSLRPTESLGPWPHAVATRVALKAKAQATTRRIRERKTAVSIADNPRDDLLWRDLRPIIDNAIAHLPSKHRIPFVLCHRQGRTVKEIAEELGQPIGTVAARLARAREQLRTRLIRRGITQSAAGLATALSENLVTASVPTSVASGTIKSAALVAAGRAVAAAFIPNKSHSQPTTGIGVVNQSGRQNTN